MRVIDEIASCVATGSNLICWRMRFPNCSVACDGLQAAVEVDRRLDTAVSKHPPYRLVVSRLVLEIDRRRSMSKLVRRYPKSDRFLDARQ